MKPRTLMVVWLLGLAACQSLPVDQHTSEKLAASRASAQATLENTYWKLVRLASTGVTVAGDQREPHFILHPDGKRVSGSGGCNRMAGTYTVDDDRLSFSRMAGTLMACPDGMEQERAFHEALGHVTTWRVDGENLQLLDGDGDVVLQFESRYME
jgi:heat shock protein HslJ